MQHGIAWQPGYTRVGVLYFQTQNHPEYGLSMVELLRVVGDSFAADFISENLGPVALTLERNGFSDPEADVLRRHDRIPGPRLRSCFCLDLEAPQGQLTYGPM